MTVSDLDLLGPAIDITFVLLLAGIALAAIRLVRGPSLPDRVIALDLITILAVAFCALFAIASSQAAFLDVAIALALVAFLATVALARFAERRLQQSGRDARDAESDP